jgi:hypothetical protein
MAQKSDLPSLRLSHPSKTAVSLSSPIAGRSQRERWCSQLGSSMNSRLYQEHLEHGKTMCVYALASMDMKFEVKDLSSSVYPSVSHTWRPWSGCDPTT